MTPSQVIALIRDVLILAALGFLVWWIWRSGEDRVKVTDMAAVQKQLAANARTLEQWKAQSTQAETQHAADLETIRSTLAQHSAPILVRVPAPAAGPYALPGASPAPRCEPAGAGGDHGATGGGSRTVDIRPAVTAVEERAEEALADCRAALAKWPR